MKYYDELLELEESGEVEYNIGGRGGSYTISNDAAVKLIAPGDDDYDYVLYHIPARIGCGCNYLGGGIRGALVGTSGFIEHKVPPQYAEQLDDLVKAMKARYEEHESGLNEEEYEDGETNWEAVGTNAARRAGIRSAY